MPQYSENPTGLSLVDAMREHGAAARGAWDADAAIYRMSDGTMWYRRTRNSYGWPWKPTYADLVADDWIDIWWPYEDAV